MELGHLSCVSFALSPRVGVSLACSREVHRPQLCPSKARSWQGFCHPGLSSDEPALPLHVFVYFLILYLFRVWSQLAAWGTSKVLLFCWNWFPAWRQLSGLLALPAAGGALPRRQECVPCAADGVAPFSGNCLFVAGWRGPGHLGLGVTPQQSTGIWHSMEERQSSHVPPLGPPCPGLCGKDLRFRMAARR